MLDHGFHLFEIRDGAPQRAALGASIECTPALHRPGKDESQNPYNSFTRLTTGAAVRGRGKLTQRSGESTDLLLVLLQQ